MKDRINLRVFIALLIIFFIILFLSIIIINYYSKETVFYFDVLTVDILAVLFSIFLVYDGLKNINEKYIGSLIKISGGTAIFIIHLLEIIFIRILR